MPTAVDFDVLEQAPCDFLDLTALESDVRELVTNLAQPVDEAITAAANERDIDGVYFVAVGGSYGALGYAQYFLQRTGKRPALLMNANEFLVRRPPGVDARSMVVLASHSGNTPEVVAAAALARQRGAFVVTVGGSATGKFHASADYPCVAEVRSASVAAHVQGMLIAVAYLHHVEGDEAAAAAVLADLRALPDFLAATHDASVALARSAASRFAEVDHLYVAGHGTLAAFAHQLAIIGLHEFARVTATPLDLGDFFHGPLEAMEAGQHLLLFHDVNENSRTLSERVERFCERVGVDTFVADAKRIAPDASEYLSFFTLFRFARHFTSYMGLARGHNPDDKRYMGVIDY